MSTTAPARPSVPGMTWAQRRTLIVSCMAVALVVASMAALYTALAPISVATDADHTETAWIVDSYTLVLACLVLPAGALGDRFGRRLLLLIGLVIFAVASALSVVQPDVTGLIAGRAMAGFGAALIMPSTLSLITSGFPEETVRRAIGVWAGFAGSGGLLGLIGSGVLLRWWPWESVFIGMAAVAVLLFAVTFTLTESHGARTAKMDTFGAVTSIAAIGSFVWALIEVTDRGWDDPSILIGFGITVVALILFVVVESRVSAPMIDLRLFTLRGFGSATGSLTIQFLITFGVFLIAVQYLQLVLGYDPLEAALAILPMGVAMVALSAVSPRLAARYGLRLPTVAGLVVLGLGLLLLTRQGAESGYPGFLLALLVLSIGLGLTAAPATAAIMNDSPAGNHGVAAAVNDAAREIGAAIGIAISGTVLASGYRAGIDPALPRLPESVRDPVSHSLAATAEFARHAGPQADPVLALARTAFVAGMHRSAFVLAGISFVGAALLGIWAPGPQRGDAGAEPGDAVADLRETGSIAES